MSVNCGCIISYSSDSELLLDAREELLPFTSAAAGLGAAEGARLDAVAGTGLGEAPAVSESCSGLPEGLLCLGGDGPISRPKATPDLNSPRRDLACQRRTTEEALMRT